METFTLKQEELGERTCLSNTNIDLLLDFSFPTISIAYVPKSRFVSVEKVENFITFSKTGNECFAQIVESLFSSVDRLYGVLKEFSDEIDDDFSLFLHCQLLFCLFLTKPGFLVKRGQLGNEGEEVGQLFRFYDQYVNGGYHHRFRFKIEELYRIRWLATIDQLALQLNGIYIFTKLVKLFGLRPIKSDSVCVITACLKNMQILYRFVLVELFMRHQRFVKFLIIFYLVLKPQLPNGLPPAYLKK